MLPKTIATMVPIKPASIRTGRSRTRQPTGTTHFQLRLHHDLCGCAGVIGSFMARPPGTVGTILLRAPDSVYAIPGTSLSRALLFSLKEYWQELRRLTGDPRQGLARPGQAEQLYSWYEDGNLNSRRRVRRGRAPRG